MSVVGVKAPREVVCSELTAANLIEAGLLPQVSGETSDGDGRTEFYAPPTEIYDDGDAIVAGAPQDFEVVVGELTEDNLAQHDLGSLPMGCWWWVHECIREWQRGDYRYGRAPTMTAQAVAARYGQLAAEAAYAETGSYSLPDAPSDCDGMPWSDDDKASTWQLGSDCSRLPPWMTAPTKPRDMQPELDDEAERVVARRRAAVVCLQRFWRRREQQLRDTEYVRTVIAEIDASRAGQPSAWSGCFRAAKKRKRDYFDVETFVLPTRGGGGWIEAV